MLGGNGLASVWDANKYFYMCESTPQLIRARGGVEFLSSGGNAGILVKDEGVKIVEGGVEKPVSPIIGGGRVGVDGTITEKVGSLNLSSPGPVGAVIKVNHRYNSTNYIVMLTVDRTRGGDQDNIVTLVSKTANYFEVKGKNSTNASDEATPFYFTMIRIG